MKLLPRYASGATEGDWYDVGGATRETLDRLVPGTGGWHVEIGFGKGRYLLEQATAHPERRYLGIEVVSKYQRMLARRARNRGLDNLVLIRGEALFLLATSLPRAFAETLHVYFPDPWPKSRHHRRRLFDAETVDLVLGVLRPGGTLYFASDHLDYGAIVEEVLSGVPELALERHDAPWEGGARTNYEAKFITEGRPIRRLIGRLAPDREAGLHPEGACRVVAATAHRAAPSDPATEPEGTDRT